MFVTFYVLTVFLLLLERFSSMLQIIRTIYTDDDVIVFTTNHVHIMYTS